MIICRTNNLLLQLFLDDAKMKNFTSCYKELHFLKFFFKRLKKNDSMRYTEDFPYLSLCGKVPFIYYVNTKLNLEFSRFYRRF